MRRTRTCSTGSARSPRPSRRFSSCGCATRARWTSGIRWRSICRAPVWGRRPSPNCSRMLVDWRPRRRGRGGSGAPDRCGPNSPTCWANGPCCLRPAAGSTTRTRATRCSARSSRSCAAPPGRKSFGAKCSNPWSCIARVCGLRCPMRVAGRCIPGPTRCSRSPPRTWGAWPRQVNCGRPRVTWRALRPSWSTVTSGC